MHKKAVVLTTIFATIMSGSSIIFSAKNKDDNYVFNGSDSSDDDSYSSIENKKSYAAHAKKTV